MHGAPIRGLLGAALLALAVAMPAAGLQATPTSLIAPTPPPADELPRLLAGETVVRVDGLEGVVRQVLDTPPERLYRAAADWQHYDEFFPFVEESEAAAGADGTVTARQVVDLPFPWADRHFAARLEHGAGDGRWRVAWRAVPGSGNVTENRGEWTFREVAPGRTLVELRLVSDAGPGVPDAFQRRALAETLPYAVDGLRQQANRCRYDLPRHPTCGEAPPLPDVAPTAGAAP